MKNTIFMAIGFFAMIGAAGTVERGGSAKLGAMVAILGFLVFAVSAISGGFLTCKR